MSSLDSDSLSNIRNNLCALGCGRVVNIDSPDSWKQVIGYVGGLKKDSMRLREDTGNFAHGDCVQRIMDGQAPDQESLFDDTDSS